MESRASVANVEKNTEVIDGDREHMDRLLAVITNEERNRREDTEEGKVNFFYKEDCSHATSECQNGFEWQNERTLG